MLGFATLLVGGFSRFGVWRQVGWAVVALIFVQLLTNWAANRAGDNLAQWPLVYLPAVVGAAICVLLLMVAAGPCRPLGRGSRQDAGRRRGHAMILARYVANRYLRAFLLLAGVFLAILLIDMVEQIRRAADMGITIGTAARLSALSVVAGSFGNILPLIALLAGIMLFLNLSRSSEMVAIRASGRSGLRTVPAPAVMAALICIAAVAILNPIVAATQTHYLAAVARIESGASTVSLARTRCFSALNRLKARRHV